MFCGDLDDASKQFLVLSLIVCCIVVFLSRDLITAGLVIALIASVARIWTSGNTGIPIVDNLFDAPVDAPVGPESTGSLDAPEVNPAGADPADMYGPYYDMWYQSRAEYTDCYPGPRAPAVAMMSNDVDSGMAMIGIDRARDGKTIDARAVRDANYFKHHFGDEFEQSEARPWWGRHEY